MIRLVIIGYGKMGQIHARAIRRMQSACLVSVVDPSEPPLSDCPLFRSMEDLLQTIDFDAAVIASPSASHRNIADQLLRSGKPILIEKPATGSSRQARELSLIAQASGLPVFVSFPERFNPVILKLREISAGYAFRKITLQRITPDTCNIRKDGILRDLTIHDLDLTQWISRDVITDYQAELSKNKKAVTVRGFLKNSASFDIYTSADGQKKRTVSAEAANRLYFGDLLNRQLMTQPADSSWESTNLSLVPADPIEAQLNEWIQYLNDRKTTALATLEETIDLLQIIESIEKINY